MARQTCQVPPMSAPPPFAYHHEFTKDNRQLVAKEEVSQHKDCLTLTGEGGVDIAYVHIVVHCYPRPQIDLEMVGN